jgi:hypothetical protein
MYYAEHALSIAGSLSRTSAPGLLSAPSSLLVLIPLLSSIYMLYSIRLLASPVRLFLSPPRCSATPSVSDRFPFPVLCPFLSPDVFPAIRKMEAEIVSQCLHMFSNPTGAGATTSGGTESILLACKSYRDWGRKVKGITRPEMWVILCSSSLGIWCMV